ncbi:conjugal transfer protein TraG N-terminal domain-containing protein (plasmid) [Cytobacillus firmus]|uniref:conjugal transfer protein TraG N-terminal domain-containing protein n=1 Tax=Cytobacillus firmus TaxID=1399 RepID=UPI00207A86F5|nr:conjugal transfer protein TraG N-terminal domain-containing protein [Cytobacillus firmus]USK41597.1 conjugal transfer protein TraG N-terminal domain-containing protein [Cytobacillus firmus]
MQDKIMDIFESLFEKMLEWILGPFKDLDTLKGLIYDTGKEEYYYGVFNEDQFGVIAQGMAVMQSLSVGFILVSIILAGMRISSSGINPSNRTYTFEYFKDFILVAILFFNLSTIFEIMYSVNEMFVSTFSSAKEVMDGDIAKQATTFLKQGVLGGLIIGLVLLGLSLWANFYYMMRTLTLMILTIMSPLAVALYLIPQTKGITAGLFKEYAGTVFVQSVHAGVYWVIAAIAGANPGIGSILLYIIFIPVTESIRSLLGLGGQMNDRLSKTAAMMGGSALMGVAGAVKGALSGQSVAQSLRSAAGQVAKNAKGGKDGTEEDGAKGLLAGAGTDIGSTSRAERMLKAGEIFSKGGKAVFGAAGAIAGSPMGPVGSIAGSTLGFSAGGAIGGVAGRAGMAGAELLADRAKAGFKAGKNKFDGLKNAEAHADEKLANTLADKETSQWAGENKDAFLKDIKERFPDATDREINQMWDKQVASKQSDFLEKARSTVKGLKAQNGKLAKASDLVDSTVNNLTNDWARNNEDTFKQNYDAAHPLPANATEAEKNKHNQNKNEAWNQKIAEKRNAINGVVLAAASKLGFGKLDGQSFINKDDFISEVGNQVGSVLGMNGKQESLGAVKDAINSVNLNRAKATDLINTSVGGLTKEWASKNKEAFMRNYDNENPLPTNASTEEKTMHQQSKEAAWNQALGQKQNAIKNAAISVASKLGNGSPVDSSSINKEEFVNQLGNKVSSITGFNNPESIQAVKAATNGVKVGQAQGSELIGATVSNLTSKWAKNNRESFMKNYDMSNPLPADASSDTIQTHNQNREVAWQNAVAGKRNTISQIASKAASKLGYIPSSTNSYINKDDFVNEVGNEVGAVIGAGQSASLLAVRGATSAVKNASLYSGKSVNTPFLRNQLASMQTNKQRDAFVEQHISSNPGATRQEAVQEWNTSHAPSQFQKNLNALANPVSGLPRHIPLDHRLIGGGSFVRGASGLGAGVASGVLESTGIISGPKAVSKFVGDSKLGTLVRSLPVETRTAWENRDPIQNPVTAAVDSVGLGIKQSWDAGRNHIAQNVLEKQSGFRNAVAYTTGMIGGVKGYKAGANYAAGGTQVTKAFGLKGWNPYNNAVNQKSPDVAEISEIEQMAQTIIGDDGQKTLASGAVRMVTTKGQTVLQVRTKSGQLQTVSRIGSGDSSLKKGETLYQDLSIQDGQLTPTSNVYQEDSGGGRVNLNRTINVNPNKLVANRNTPKTPRVVKEVQSYNQLVDSGQYYLKNAMSEMSNIEMIVDRNRSYLQGVKNGQTYRISPYGSGDTRISPDETQKITCEMRNNKLIPNNTDGYTTSLKPEDLVAYRPANKRNMMRKQNDKFRNKAFVEGLR